ncbi:hypothetical protein [Streptomyces recifensis]|uniref:hypothetical protein n=1 Tax=Streptomyces recifensis TaxID=67355 RepID=UPI000A3C0107|nr:hypothetical protein [Streptomyces recifensis]
MPHGADHPARGPGRRPDRPHRLGRLVHGGASQTFHAQEDSEVTVAYNDRSGLYGDNSGEYTALVENHGRPS